MLRKNNPDPELGDLLGDHQSHGERLREPLVRRLQDRIVFGSENQPRTQVDGVISEPLVFPEKFDAEVSPVQERLGRIKPPGELDFVLEVEVGAPLRPRCLRDPQRGRAQPQLRVVDLPSLAATPLVTAQDQSSLVDAGAAALPGTAGVAKFVAGPALAAPRDRVGPEGAPALPPLEKSFRDAARAEIEGQAGTALRRASLAPQGCGGEELVLSAAAAEGLTQKYEILPLALRTDCEVVAGLTAKGTDLEEDKL